MKDYYRNRPFLLVKMIYTPKAGVNTSTKGWTNDSNNITVMEQVSIVDRLNNNSWLSDVIIDITEAKTIRNRTPLSDEDVMSDYVSKYRNKVTEALKVWSSRIVNEELKNNV